MLFYQEDKMYSNLECFLCQVFQLASGYLFIIGIAGFVLNLGVLVLYLTHQKVLIWNLFVFEFEFVYGVCIWCLSSISHIKRFWFGIFLYLYLVFVLILWVLSIVLSFRSKLDFLEWYNGYWYLGSTRSFLSSPGKMF